MRKTGNEPSAGNSAVLSQQGVITTASRRGCPLTPGQLSGVHLETRSIKTSARAEASGRPGARVQKRRVRVKGLTGRRSCRNRRLLWQRVYKHTTPSPFKAFMMCLMHREVKKKNTHTPEDGGVWPLHPLNLNLKEMNLLEPCCPEPGVDEERH